MKCLKCGAEINDSAKFCPYCGAEQKSAENTDSAESSVLSGQKEEESSEKKEEAAISPEKTDAGAAEKEEGSDQAPAEEMTSSSETAASRPEPEKEAETGSTDACAPKFTQENIRKKLSSFRQLSIYLFDPTAETKLDLIPAVVIIAVSCVANSWLVYSMLSAVIRTVLGPVVGFFGQTINVAKIMEELGYGFGSFLSGGLTATVLILVFMLIVTFLGSSRQKSIFEILCEAAGNMAIPTVMILLAACFFQMSIIVGMVFVIAALSSYIVVITSRLPQKMNVYVKIILVTLFIMLLCFCFSNALSLNTLFAQR